MTDANKKRLRQWLPAIKIVFQIIGGLLLIQGMRAALNWVGWRIIKPDAGNPWWDIIIIFSVVLPGALFWLLLRPPKTALGLEWRSISRAGRISLFIGGGLLLGLLLSSFLLDTSLIATNLQAVLVVPVFEELLFRGWSWSRLERVMPGRLGGFLCFIITTGLFALWHLGYADVVFLRGVQGSVSSPPLQFILVMKVLVGGAVGVMTGFARWRTGKVYWPILLHGLWNIFGR